MTARIIALTQPIIDFEGDYDCTNCMTVEEFLAYVARVSNPSNQSNTLTAKKLLKYLAKHKHWSPFEMVHIVMEINTTRDIGRQILRHRSFSFQEFSQRYADPTQLGFVNREARLQDTKNRQNSIETDNFILNEQWQDYQNLVKSKSLEAYDWAIKNGIAKEQARAVLPEGLTTTRMFMAGTLRSWIHYILIRSNKDTQKEHRQIAIEAWNNILVHFPSLSEFFDDSVNY